LKVLDCHVKVFLNIVHQGGVNEGSASFGAVLWWAEDFSNEDWSDLCVTREVLEVLRLVSLNEIIDDVVCVRNLLGFNWSVEV
jgi:hypothetical protein